MNYENIQTMKESRLTSLALMLINVNNRGLNDLDDFADPLFPCLSLREKRVLNQYEAGYKG